MGVAMPGAGRSCFHNCSPVLTSNARMWWSSVAPMKTIPDAVTIGPPQAGEPQPKDSGIVMPHLRDWPSGTCHLSSPVSRSMADSVPHGGGVHGTPSGERNGSVYFHHGVPRKGTLPSGRYGVVSSFS